VSRLAGQASDDQLAKRETAANELEQLYASMREPATRVSETGALFLAQLAPTFSLTLV